MFSLLPPEHKEKLLKEYRMRMLIITLSFLTLILIVGIVFLVPTYLKVKVSYDSSFLEEDSIKRAMSSDEDSDVIKSIEEIKMDMSAGKIDSRSSVSPILKAVEVRGSDISIKGFVYDYSPGASVLSISGIAKDRRALTEYSKRLSSVEIFKKTDLPISNLAKEFDLPFTIIVSGEF